MDGDPATPMVCLMMEPVTGKTAGSYCVGNQTPLLELVAHEMAHAYFRNATETRVGKFAEDFASA
jgi:hypothetical protein